MGDSLEEIKSTNKMHKFLTFITIFGVLLVVLIATADAFTMNDTLVQSLGLNSQFNVTTTWEFSKLSINSNYIFFELFNRSNPNELHNNYTVTFNFTEPNKNYLGTDIPYLKNTTLLNATITSGLDTAVELNMSMPIQDCDRIPEISYTSASGTYTNTIVNHTCVGNQSYFILPGIEDGDNHLTWNWNWSFDNCSTYTTPVLNFSFYSSPGIVTAADSRTIFDCTLGTQTLEWNQTMYSQESVQFCMYPHYVSPTCTVTEDYAGFWTQGWIYQQTFNYITLSNTTQYYNLTIPKLFINFTNGTGLTTTDVKIVTGNETFYYEATEVLVAMTNLTIGKVSVIFNNGTQYYEYDNDQNTYIRETMYVIP
jgi:hypothetical protein